MANKKDLVIAVLATFCLTATLFAIMPASSVPTYNPWLDINDDGKIDLKDYYTVGKAYGAYGYPTKPIVIEGYNWNESSYIVNVEPQTRGNLNISTSGYSQISLGFDTNTSSQTVEIRTAFLFEDHFEYMDCFNVSAPQSIHHVSNSIWVDPATIDVFQPKVGDKFNVTVWAQDVSSIGAAQIRMYFNDDILNVTRWFEPKSDPRYIFYGRTTSALPIPPNPGYTHVSSGKGYVQTSVSLYPPNPPYFSGSGKICIFELKITRLPKVGEPSFALSIDNRMTYMLDGASGNEIANVAKYDGLIRWEWNYLVKTYAVRGRLLTIVYYNPSNERIQLRIVVYLTTASGPSLSENQNVNVTNWPSDRALSLKRAVEKITIIDYFSAGAGNGHGVVLGKPISDISIARFIFDFEPKGQLYYVADIYVDYVWRADVAGTLSNPHSVAMIFWEEVPLGGEFDYIYLDQGIGDPSSIEPIAYCLRFSQQKPDFNFTLVQPGLNSLELSRNDQYGNYIYLHNLVLFIEYLYWG